VKFTQGLILSEYTGATWVLHAMTFPRTDGRSSTRWTSTESGREFDLHYKGNRQNSKGSCGQLPGLLTRRAEELLSKLSLLPVRVYFDLFTNPAERVQPDFGEYLDTGAGDGWPRTQPESSAAGTRWKQEGHWVAFALWSREMRKTTK